MLGKSSVLMMLLLGTGSLVGISSMYKPANVETQPQTFIPQGPTSKPLITDPQVQRTMEDKQLLDRLMPKIINRIDGKILAAKVLPYLEVVRRDGAASVLNVQDIARDLGLTGAENRGSTAKCNTGEIAVSGGFSFQSDPEDSYVGSVTPNTQQNGWFAGAQMGDNGKIQAFVTCLKVKGVQQPQPQQPSQPPSQPQPLSQPPGGPPLQPPPNLR